jgi:hypothetical protein
MITVTTMSSYLLVIVSLQWLLLAHVKFITASFLGNENLQTNITDEEQIYRVISCCAGIPEKRTFRKWR